MNWQTILECFRVPGTRIFVLGCLDTHVTIRSQQIRAQKLLMALKHQRILESGARVAIIGGGAAGLTAAVWASKYGTSPTLFEKEQKLLPIQYGSKRKIYPRLYEWPVPGWNGERAGLDYLDWSAASAEAVRGQILDDWETHCRTEPVDVRLGTKVEICQPESAEQPPVVIEWIEGQSHQEQVFDVAVVAVGFGTERVRAVHQRLPRGVYLGSYWDDTDLHQGYTPAHGTRLVCLVSGCGDGGVTDALRIRTGEIDFQGLIECLSRQDVVDVGYQLTAVEREMPAQSEGEYLRERYRSLELGSVDEFLRARLVGDTELVLVGRRGSALTRKACILNRMMISRLLMVDPNSRFLPGLVEVDRMQPTLNGDSIDVPVYAGQDATIIRSHRVLVRHGPSPVVGDLVQRDACDKLRTISVLGLSGAEMAGEAPVPTVEIVALGGDSTRTSAGSKT